MKTVKRGLICIGMIAALLLGTPACGQLEQLADPSVTAPAGETMPAPDVDHTAAALLPDSVGRASRFPDCGPNKVRSGKDEGNWRRNTRNSRPSFVRK